jgi:hypothetical protein
MSYRPITDVWILARPKVKYYGAYPAGFLHRARALLGVGEMDPVLHVCGGKVRDYPFRGFGPNDKTLDLDPACNPDFLRDAREPFPLNCRDADHPPCRATEPALLHAPWAAVLIDRPYTVEDAAHYVPGPSVLPTANQLVRQGIAVVPVGGKVGMLDFTWPQPPKNAREVAVIAVGTGRNARARWFCVFERLS